MSDILSYGQDREPRWPRGPRWRRWRPALAVAACLAVALAVVLVWSVPGVRHHGAQARPGGLGPGIAVQGNGPGAVPDPLTTRPALMTGQPLPRAAGLRLLLGGQRPAWFLVSSGRTEPVRGLPARGNGYQLMSIAGGWTAQANPPGAACASCAPAPLPVYYFADGSRAAKRIGAADAVAPAAAPGALWLVSYRPGADMDTAAGTAREVSVTGAALGPRLRLPAGYVVYQGTRAGLLLVRQEGSSGPVRYELWDPGARRVTRSFANVIAASPAEIAWVPACARSCPVSVADLPGGGTREISLPGGTHAGQGAFSPDGRLLALLVTAGMAANGYPAANQLWVATLATGRSAEVPGTAVGSGIGVTFGWQPGSGRLMAEVAIGAVAQPEWQIGLWQPGAARLFITLGRTPYNSWPVFDQAPY